MIKEKKILLIISVLVIVMIMSGCSNKTIEMTVNEEDVFENVLEDEKDVLVMNVEDDKDVLRLYISADRTGTKESGISIEQGVRTALDEVDYSVNGMNIELVVLDHRGSTPRSDQHLKDYLEDDKALAIFSGLHSPPLLASRDYINENEILMLDPWAAAAPITRYPSKENWIFRVSIDDSKAGFVIAKYAIEKEGFKRPYLLLEETGWGESNKKTMTKALEEYAIEVVETGWFNWNLGKNQAKLLLRQAKELGADVVFFVGNAPEGKVLAQAMSELSEEERLPIRSHWGITGGDFPKVIDKSIRDKIDLLFIQTSFSFISMEDNELGKKVFKRTTELFPESIKYPEDIEAPTGFTHSYDLTKILIQAMNQIEWTGNIKDDRRNVRRSLENIEIPVEGLVKTYKMPFTVYTEDTPDAHEALSIEDFVMARYGDNNEIILLK